MDLLLFPGLLVTPGAAALRCGRDSRAGLRSREQELASFGMSWQVRPGA
jgi:hypothetical protein